MFYVYEWYDTDTNKVFYVGKGTGNRYKVRKHNSLFNEYLAEHSCESRIVRTFELEGDAFDYELAHIFELWDKDEAWCNIYAGGTGGTQSWWTDERRRQYSENNVMKTDAQRKRMSEHNPMKDRDTASKVGTKLQRGIVLGNVRYDNARVAGEANGVHEATIRAWCKAGVSSDGRKCFYADGEPVRKTERRSYEHRLSSMARPVLVDGTYFESTSAAARFLGVRLSNLKVAISRNGKYKGHICRYANQQPSQGKADESTLEGSTTNG